MKKILAIGMALVMLAMTSVPLSADDTETIDINMTPGGVVDIIIKNSTDSEWNSWSPTCSVGDSSTADTDGDINPYIENNGTVNVEINVSADDTTDWTIGDAAGHDVFSINLTGGDLTFSGGDYLDTTEQDFTDTLNCSGAETVVDFDLLLTMPTSSSTSDPQTTTITFTATAN